MLNKLGFRYIPNQGVDVWVKTYGCFSLYVAESKTSMTTLIKVGENEISIPQRKKEIKIDDFDKTIGYWFHNVWYPCHKACKNEQQKHEAYELRVNNKVKCKL